MGWFSKKKEENMNENIPELPELPDLPNNNVDYGSPPKTTISDIPYPQAPVNDFDNRHMTREVEPTEYTEYIKEPKPGMQKSKFEPIKISEDYKNPPSMPPMMKKIEPKMTTQEYNQSQERLQPKTREYFSPPINKMPEKRNEPVYIRLDKFQMSIDTFREIKDKIREIEDLLSRTKEVKAREDKEISEWEREIETIKMKIQSVDKEMFDYSSQ
jgi:hypothetical protein